MMRGDLVTIAMQGDFGKPRPALVVQANQFSEHDMRPSEVHDLLSQPTEPDLFDPQDWTPD